MTDSGFEMPPSGEGLPAGVAGAAISPVFAVPLSTGWRLWARQAMAVGRLELPRCLWSGRAVALYLLAAAPIALMLVAVAGTLVSGYSPGLAEAERQFAGLYAVFVLRWCVFFACVAVFMSLFRSDVIDRTLHYWLLAPVRREALVVGKYLAALGTTGAVLGTSTALSAVLLYVPYDRALGLERLLYGPGLGNVLDFVLVTLLACVGYGAVFLLIGVWFRNPVVPTLVVLGWEYANFLLPPSLRAASIVFYLQSLLPMPLTEGPLGVVAEPAPAWLAVTGLLVFSFALLAASAWRLRRMEVAYSDS